jgi:hypothetical protein
LRWNTQLHPDQFVVPELPYGTHKIKWFVLDGCGNEEVREYNFVVKDCKPPTVTCLNGLSINIMPTGMIDIDVLSFVKDAYDNCTPSNLLIYGIQSSGNGGGFPYTPDGAPQTSLTFTCDDVGFVLVEIWAMDLAGNSDFCETYLKVQDNFGICSATSATVAGGIFTEAGQGVEDVNLQLQSVAPAGQAPFSLITASDPTGQFLLPNALPLHSNAILTPLKDNDPLNGVSTFDLVLINKHILGLEPLSTPYKMIAADANNSRSITTFDILELRKLILGLYTNLPENTSWRFIDKSYVFPNPYNPFQELFPETKEIVDVQQSQLEEDFIAVKTGDVNGNVVTNSLLYVDERTDGLLLFDIQDQFVEAGETVLVRFVPSEPVAGYQFTLYFPKLELLEIEPGAAMQVENFAVFTADHTLTSSFNTTISEQTTGDFALRFRVLEAGTLSRLLSLSSQITRAEAYRLQWLDTPNGGAEVMEQLELSLRFQNDAAETISGVGFELYQNQPNPWTNSTRIGFHLPEMAEAVLTVYDEIGTVLVSKSGLYLRGYNNITVDNSLLEGSGLLYYKLETATNRGIKKMIRMP